MGVTQDVRDNAIDVTYSTKSDREGVIVIVALLIVLILMKKKVN